MSDRTDAKTELLDRPGYRRRQHQGGPQCGDGPDGALRGLEAAGGAGPQAIAAVAATFPPSTAAAVTMTAELCDCYPTKAVGVHAILDAVVEALPGRSIAVWGVDGAVPLAWPMPGGTATGRGGQLAGTGDARRPTVPSGRGPADRHRHDHDRPDTPGSGLGRRSGTKRHGTAPVRRAGVCRSPTHAGLRPGYRAPVPRGPDRPGGRAVRLHPGCLPDPR